MDTSTDKAAAERAAAAKKAAAEKAAAERAAAAKKAAAERAAAEKAAAAKQAAAEKAAAEKAAAAKQVAAQKAAKQEKNAILYSLDENAAKTPVTTKAATPAKSVIIVPSDSDGVDPTPAPTTTVKSGEDQGSLTLKEMTDHINADMAQAQGGTKGATPATKADLKKQLAEVEKKLDQWQSWGITHGGGAQNADQIATQEKRITELTKQRDELRNAINKATKTATTTSPETTTTTKTTTKTKTATTTSPETKTTTTTTTKAATLSKSLGKATGTGGSPGDQAKGAGSQGGGQGGGPPVSGPPGGGGAGTGGKDPAAGDGVAGGQGPGSGKTSDGANKDNQPEAKTKVEEKTPEKPPPKGRVYSAQGRGAAVDSGSDKVLEETFGKGSLTIVEKPTKQELLENIPKSEVVILNAHGLSSTKWIREETTIEIPQIDTDDNKPEGKIHPSDLARSVRAAKTAPIVTFLNVCAIGSRKDPKQFTFADALGVTPTTQKRAVIGYNEKIVGQEADQLSTLTLNRWKQGGTLNEALEWAKATMRKTGRTPVNKKVSRAYGAKYAPDAVVLIGDGNIRITDLTGSPAKVGR